MTLHRVLFLAIFCLASLAVPVPKLKLPSDFGFGAATAAYQIEGGWLEDDKGLSGWDNAVHTQFTETNVTGDVVADSYHKFDQDIAIMREHGIKHFRMSLSWVRIIPYGQANSKVNMKGIEHYQKVLKMLNEAGIEPYVTLYHWDLPAYLQIVGDGDADPDFPDDFEYYARICFKYFGHLVRHWFTFNEPWCTTVLTDFEPEDEATKPYKIAHNVLIAHGKAVKLYRESFQKTQHGLIGIVTNSEYYYPKNPADIKDVEAVKRSLIFQLGWFAEPIFLGDYPQLMKDIVGDRLPKFTDEERSLVKGSADFFAVNHYFSYLAEPLEDTKKERSKEGKSYWNDRNVNVTFHEDWRMTDGGWPIVPQGMHDILMYIQNTYLKGTSIPILITENGIVVSEKNTQESLNDFKRIEFMSLYIKAVEQAILDGANVKRYFYWALLDDFEWGPELEVRFGLIRVDFWKDPKRTPKGSLAWYADLIRNH